MPKPLNNPNEMSYEVFIDNYRRGKVSAGIDRLPAQWVIRLLPMHYGIPLILGSWLWILSIPVAICASIFYDWWSGILLFIVTSAIRAFAKEWNAQLILDYAIHNKDFFDILVENRLLVFRLNE